MVQKTVFFGIGAQRSGTTWLHNVLQAYPDCAVPPIKEIHFFDTKYLSDDLNTVAIYKERLAQMTAMANGFSDDVMSYLELTKSADKKPYETNFLRRVNVEDRLNNIIRLARYLRIRNIDDYATYLDEIRLTKDAAAVGEITPSYSLLPAAAFREMDSRFPGCRFIYVMRDPVQRFLSQIQFRHKRQVKKGNEFDPVAFVDRALLEQDFTGRSDYRRTVEALESVIPAHRILYLFFEEMVSATSLVPALRRLEEFLGLAPREETVLKELADMRENQSSAAEFTTEQRARVKAALSDSYEFVRRHFGRLPVYWTDSLAN